MPILVHAQGEAIYDLFRNDDIAGSDREFTCIVLTAEDPAPTIDIEELPRHPGFPSACRVTTDPVLPVRIVCELLANGYPLADAKDN